MATFCLESVYLAVVNDWDRLGMDKLPRRVFWERHQTLDTPLDACFPRDSPLHMGGRATFQLLPCLLPTQSSRTPALPLVVVLPSPPRTPNAATGYSEAVWGGQVVTARGTMPWQPRCHSPLHPITFTDTPSPSPSPTARGLGRLLCLWGQSQPN